MGEIIGATIIVLLISLLLRKLLLKLTKLTRRVATSAASVGAVLVCTLAALPQFGQVAVLIYPVAGVVVWIWLFFDLPIGIRFFGSLVGLVAGAVLGTLVGIGFNNIPFAAVVGGCIGLILGFCFLKRGGFYIQRLTDIP